jgi:hypothetical protein
MYQTGNVVIITLSENRHWRHAGAGIFIGDIPFRRHRRFEPVNDFDFVGRRQRNGFPCMSDHFIRKDDYGNTVFFRQIKGINSNFKGIENC